MFFIGFISDFQRALRFLSLCFSCFSFIKQRRQNALPRRLIMWNKKVILIALISLDVDGKLITNPACYTYLSLKSFNCTRHVFITKHEDSYVSGKWSENEPRQKKGKEKEKEKEKVSFLARVSIFRKRFYLISFPISIYKHNQAFVSVRSHMPHLYNNTQGLVYSTLYGETRPDGRGVIKRFPTNCTLVCNMHMPIAD